MQQPDEVFPGVLQEVQVQVQEGTTVRGNGMSISDVLSPSLVLAVCLDCSAPASHSCIDKFYIVPFSL